MSKEMRASIVLDLAGNLQSQAKRYDEALGGLARNGARHMSMLGRATAGFGRTLDRIGNRYTALITGAAGAGTIRMLANLEERMTYLGIQAGVSQEQMTALKKELFSVAQAADTAVDPSKLLEAFNEIVEKTGDFKFAKDNLRNFALAIRATNAEGQAMGGIAAEFEKMGMKDPKQVLQTLDILNQQGKMGAFTLQNLAALGPRVITAYTATGRSGQQAAREMGAALQVIRMGTGTSEMAATSFEALLRNLMDPQKGKMLSRVGIQLFDPEAAKKGERVLRPINELLTEIVTKSKGDQVKLGKIFEADALRAFAYMSGELHRTGSLDTIKKFMEVQGDGATTMNDAARAARDASAAMTSLSTAWKQLADEELTGPIQHLAELMHELGPDRTGKILKGLAVGGLGLGGLVLGRKLYTGGRALGEMFGLGRKGGAGGALGELASMSRPLPVYVVNSRMSLMPGEYGAGRMGGGGTAAEVGRELSRNGGKWARFGRWAGYGLGALGAGATIYDLATTPGVTGRQAGGDIGRVVGGFGGWEAGAAMGTLVAPGVGTIIGGILGGLLGQLGGGMVGERMGGAFSNRGAGDQPRASLRIQVEDNRVRVDRVDSSAMDVDLATGLSMAGR